MKRDFYRSIKNYFVSVRFSYSMKINHVKNQENLLYYKNALKPFYNELILEIHENDNEILIYCIDTLFEIMAEGDYIKINAFADTIHNMPEICMGVRPLHTFSGEISDFRSRYGEKYFPFFNLSKNDRGV